MAGQHEFNNIKLIECSRKLDHGIKRYTYLSEIDRSDVLVVNKEAGYYVVNQLFSIPSVILLGVFRSEERRVGKEC